MAHPAMFKSGLIIISLAAYAMAALAQVFREQEHDTHWRWSVLLLGLVALVGHAYLLYTWVDAGQAYNLSFFNMLSLVLWCVTVWAWFASLFRPMENFLIFMAPLDILSIVLILIFPHQYFISAVTSTPQLVHILLSLVLVSVFVIAICQATLLILRHKKLKRAMSLERTPALPPLQIMERMLFQMIWVGFFLLTVILIFGFIAVFHLNWQDYIKVGFAILAWLVLLALLIGRYAAGWRGRRMVRWTLRAMIVLVIACFFGLLISYGIRG
jgi:ABC-type uncharacterized transport system permease subunit